LLVGNLNLIPKTAFRSYVNFEVVGTISDIEVIAIALAFVSCVYFGTDMAEGGGRKLKGLPIFDSMMIRFVLQSYTGLRLTGLARGK
jgi:hypothetical protein